MHSESRGRGLSRPGPTVAAEVQAVVLNWRAPESTLRCVASLEESLGARVDVLVVENGSGDGSAETLARQLDEDRILALASNTGYAGGMNAGAERWRSLAGAAEFLLLVTQDVTVAPDAVARMLEVMREDERIAAVGPSIYYRHEPDRLMNRGFVHRRSWARTVPAPEPGGAEAVSVDSVDGCFLLLRRAAFDEVGGLDERFFLYFEETDLCRRLREAGWRVKVVPGARVWQEKQGVPGLHYYYYMSRNRYLFWRLHGGASVWRVATSQALETARTMGALARAVLVPSRRGEAADHRVRLLRQLRGGVAGTLDYARGRFGPMP